MLRKCFQLNTVLWLIFVIYSRVGFDFLRLMIRWREVRSRTCLFQSSDSLQYCSGSYGEYKVMRYSRETDRIWNISSVVFGVDTFFWKTWTSHGIPGWSGKRHREGKKSVGKVVRFLLSGISWLCQQLLTELFFLLGDELLFTGIVCWKKFRLFSVFRCGKIAWKCLRYLWKATTLGIEFWN